MVKISRSLAFIATVGIALCATVPALAFDRKAAVNYADRYWGPLRAQYNQAFNTTFESDCANFVSQTLIGGNLRFDSASGVLDHGAMIRAQELGIELAAHHGADTIVDYGVINELPSSLPTGDPIFTMRLLNASRTYWFEAKTHAMMITDCPVQFKMKHSKAPIY